MATSQSYKGRLPQEPNKKILKPLPYNTYKDKYNTSLNKEEQVLYNTWLKNESERRGRDISRDVETYDVQGFWKNQEKVDERGHGSDRYKKPNHPTFSNQSMYHGQDGAHGGQWTDSSFIATPINRHYNTPEDMLWQMQDDPGIELVYKNGGYLMKPKYAYGGKIPQKPSLSSTGLAAGKKPSQFSEAELRLGIQVEQEHTKNNALAMKIAMDHLEEDSQYYSKVPGDPEMAAHLGAAKDAQKYMEYGGEIKLTKTAEEIGEVDKFEPGFHDYYKMGTLFPKKNNPNITDERFIADFGEDSFTKEERGYLNYASQPTGQTFSYDEGDAFKYGMLRAKHASKFINENPNWTSKEWKEYAKSNSLSRVANDPEKQLTQFDRAKKTQMKYNMPRGQGKLPRGVDAMTYADGGQLMGYLPEYGFGSWLGDNAGKILKTAGGVMSAIPVFGQIAGPIVAGAGIATDAIVKGVRNKKLLADQEEEGEFDERVNDISNSQVNGPILGGYAEGGQIGQGMMSQNPQIVNYSKGNTHQEGVGGIPVDVKGNPSTVSKQSAVGMTEKGEVTWNGYVFSDKLTT